MKRSSLIWCKSKIELPDNLREVVGEVVITCPKKTLWDGTEAPGSARIIAHGLRHDHTGYHNLCKEIRCVNNTWTHPEKKL